MRWHPTLKMLGTLIGRGGIDGEGHGIPYPARLHLRFATASVCVEMLSIKAHRKPLEPVHLRKNIPDWKFSDDSWGGVAAYSPAGSLPSLPSPSLSPTSPELSPRTFPLEDSQLLTALVLIFVVMPRIRNRSISQSALRLNAGFDLCVRRDPGRAQGAGGDPRRSSS